MEQLTKKEIAQMALRMVQDPGFCSLVSKDSAAAYIADDILKDADFVRIRGTERDGYCLLQTNSLRHEIHDTAASSILFHEMMKKWDSHFKEESCDTGKQCISFDVLGDYALIRFVARHGDLLMGRLLQMSQRSLCEKILDRAESLSSKNVDASMVQSVALNLLNMAPQVGDTVLYSVKDALSVGKMGVRELDSCDIVKSDSIVMVLRKKAPKEEPRSMDEIARSVLEIQKKWKEQA